MSGTHATTEIVVLVGASGSGKSTWAAGRYASNEIVSSDALRAAVGTGEADLDASTDAFTVLDVIVSARLRRRLTTVIDTLGLDDRRRLGYLEAARAAGLRTTAVVFDTQPALCRARNRRRDRPVPAPALAAQLRRMRDLLGTIGTEGWDRVERVSAVDGGTAEPEAPHAGAAEPGNTLEFVLQVSRFPWEDTEPAEWLNRVALAAAGAGFTGVALMDHLIQIPQVGRAWEPIPEPWVTLGMLAALPTSLTLGTLVSPMSLHSPGRLAKTAATLDVLSGGRGFVGVGAGWFEREHSGFGLPFAPAGQRVADLERGIEIMRALWAPGTKPAAGLSETTAYPRPVGTLPVIVGARGERMLRLAARCADACNVPADPAQIERATEIMVGKRITVLDVPVCGADRDEVARTVERLRGRTAAPAYARAHHAGTVPEHIARYRDLGDRGVSTVFVALPDLTGPEQVERFAPVIAASS
jgi:alkanesulfonate monooxygenase SsuD/methylene tetrahydromethanopterin reductase-like flavin-dependent oxidoreductase (luciferase family)/predicted kinase